MKLINSITALTFSLIFNLFGLFISNTYAASLSSGNLDGTYSIRGLKVDLEGEGDYDEFKPFTTTASASTAQTIFDGQGNWTYSGSAVSAIRNDIIYGDIKLENSSDDPDSGTYTVPSAGTTIANTVIAVETFSGGSIVGAELNILVKKGSNLTNADLGTYSIRGLRVNLGSLKNDEYPDENVGYNTTDAAVTTATVTFNENGTWNYSGSQDTAFRIDHPSSEGELLRLDINDNQGTDSGSYSLDSDGTLHIDGGEISVSADTNTIIAVETYSVEDEADTVGAEITVMVKKGEGLTNADLNGTYSIRGLRIDLYSDTETNTTKTIASASEASVTFDGNGAWSYRGSEISARRDDFYCINIDEEGNCLSTLEHSGLGLFSGSHTPESGSYSVSSDGTVTGTSTTLNMSANGNTIIAVEYFNNEPNTIGVELNIMTKNNVSTSTNNIVPIYNYLLD